MIGRQSTNNSKYEGEDMMVVASFKGGKRNMCVLTIQAVKMEHRGTWECELHEECQEQWQDGESNQPRGGKEIAWAAGRRKMKRVKKKEKCGEPAVKRLRVDVVKHEELGVQAAQDIYYANLGSPVVITVRTNEQFGKCSISQGRNSGIEIAGSARRQECTSIPGRPQNTVCGEVTHGVPSC